MADFQNSQDIDFTVDQDNLFREEAITDLKVASIRRLVPVKPDGSDDPGRTPIFMGHSQIMTPEGPLPLQARLAIHAAPGRPQLGQRHPPVRRAVRRGGGLSAARRRAEDGPLGPDPAGGRLGLPNIAVG